MTLSAEQPIGIFDSGVGGLTVANAIKQALPDETIIYFGDTAHLPYGDKSSDSIKYYSTKISEFLLKNNCKVILIACNTASANAYNTVKEFVKKKSPNVRVINVIDPVIDYVIQHPEFSKIGVIGTKSTISSGTYHNKIKKKKSALEVISLATPLFVPMIEEGFIFDDISNAIIRSYLSQKELNNINALILGCTHYPIIKNQINKFYNFKVNIIDSARIVAYNLKKILSEKKLLSRSTDTKHNFYVSDYTESFEIISKMFFEEEIHLQKIDLWK